MIECAFQGRLGKDAVLDRVKGGELGRLVFDVCVTGQREDPDEPRWIRVTVLGDRAEELALEKGSQVYVEGRLTVEVEPANQPPRASMRVYGTLVQPLGQIGRRRPAQRRPANPKPKMETRPGFVRAWSQEPHETVFYDDSAEAIRDLTEGHDR